MPEVVGVVVCACFSVCWVGFMLANIIQIRNRRTKEQVLNYYLSRTSLIFALCGFTDNFATFAAYFLVGGAFEAMFVFSAIMRTLMTQIALGMLSFTTYQALLAAYTLEVVESEMSTQNLRKSFMAINVCSTVWSLVVTVVMLILNKRWPAGLVKIMWSVVIFLLGISFWYYFMLLIRTARSTAKSLGVKRVRNSLRKPVLTTALTSVIMLGLFGVGTLNLLDMQEQHHPDYIEPYVPVDEIMLLLACTTTTFFAWLPLKDTNESKKTSGSDARYVF
jgi:hypothetical protein